uniref:MYND-type domain-containing protein n=1 Tax=Heliothis virescens TaxID=7102 RepID=A0A2A4JUM0_HELVI
MSGDPRKRNCPLSDNRRSNRSESRRPTRPTRPIPNVNVPNNARQPPVLRAPIPVRPPLPPRGQIPQPPRPPRPPRATTPMIDYRVLLNIFQGLSVLDNTVHKIENDTRESYSLLSTHVTVDRRGRYRRLEPAAIALYVEPADELGRCCNCNREASTVCGKCRAAYYCSSFCLYHDWGSHEPHCNLECLTAVHATAQQRLLT